MYEVALVGSRGSLVSDRTSAIFGATPDKERALMRPHLGALISVGLQSLRYLTVLGVLVFSYSIHSPTHHATVLLSHTGSVVKHHDR